MWFRPGLLLALLVDSTLLFTIPTLAQAQQAGRVYRIGLLGAASAAGYARQLEGLRQGLRDAGYIEGRNIVIEYRWADGRYERLSTLAAELTRLNVEVIVTHGTPGTRAAKQVTATTPIVMAVAGDATATGLVASLARPGGNVTGITFLNPDLGAKRLELLKAAVPRLRRVAVITNPGNAMNRAVLSAMEQRAQPLQVELHEVAVQGPEEFEEGFAAMKRRGAEGIVVVDDGMLIANIKSISQLALTNGLPGSGFKEYAEMGGLMAYAVDWSPIWRRAAVFVDKILKGAKPGDLPVEQATKFELVINLKTARALGLTIPPSLLLRADQVIE